MIALIGSLLILSGAVFLFSAGLGLVRMPDAFTRIQAGTNPGIDASTAFAATSTPEMMPTARSARRRPTRTPRRRSGRTTANTATIAACTHASVDVNRGAVTCRIVRATTDARAIVT